MPANAFGRFQLTILAAFLGLGVLAASAAPQKRNRELPSPGRNARATSTKERSAQFSSAVKPLVRKYCACHAGPKAAGGLALADAPNAASVLKNREQWERAVRSIEIQTMPPAGSPDPTDAERKRITGWVEGFLSSADCAIRDPGRVTLRRLNREEYNNTVRDLLGVDFRPADDFPADEVGYGFDNIGDVLSVSPLLVEKYLRAAERIAASLPDSLGKLLTADPAKVGEKQAARAILASFASRAYRRPATAAEVDQLARCAEMARKEGESFEGAMRLAVTAALVSPQFLFKVELDPKPNDPKSERSLNGYEVATRLSYFLWSTMPDQRLFDLASTGALRKPAVLAAEVKRMLKDPKAAAFARNFGDQWLTLRRLEVASPNPEQFPGWSEELRKDMWSETRLFFEHVLRENRPVTEFLDARYTYLNPRLAEHYGMGKLEGEQFRKVELSDRRRGGILTQASILTVTSNPTRTSPVKRGKWVMEQILGTPPPEPPPGAPPLDNSKQAALTGSLRERMEQHRKDPNCASCHKVMDQLGFGFENFDAVGKWREMDGNFKIVPSGELPGKKRFEGPAQLRDILVERRDDFVRSLAEKMLTYALGRGVDRADNCVLDAIVPKVRKAGYGMASLITEIVISDPFLKRRGDGGAG